MRHHETTPNYNVPQLRNIMEHSWNIMEHYNNGSTLHLTLVSVS